MAKKKRNKRRTKKELEGVEREPNGRVRRSSTPKTDPRLVGIWARIRHYGVRPSDATDPEAGHAVGRAYLAGKLKHHHLDAAKRYSEIHGSAMMALQASDSLAVSDRSTPNLEESLEYVDWAIRVTAEWRMIQARLKDLGLEWAVFRCVIHNHDAETVGLAAVDHGLAVVADILGVKKMRQNVAQKDVDKSSKM